MNHKKHLSVSLFILAMALSSSGYARTFTPTPGVQGVLSQANSLKSKALNDPAFKPYCAAYAAISTKQAARRNTENCTVAIPLSSSDVADRWGQNSWRHQSWCLTVSAYATEGEILVRQRELRNCIINQPQANNDAKIKANCINNDALHKAAANGDINFVRQCLKAGTSSNIKDSNKWTPLHSAARNGRLAIAKLLVRNKAAVNAKDVHGRTPLAQAVVGNRSGMVKYLKSIGGR